MHLNNSKASILNVLKFVKSEIPSLTPHKRTLLQDTNAPRNYTSFSNGTLKSEKYSTTQGKL